jgi:YggT family protein
MALLINIIALLFRLYEFLILVEVIGSLVVALRVRLPNQVYDLLNVVHNLTEPVLGPIRRLIPPLIGLDFSPIIALILLDLVQQVILRMLWGLG